MPGLVEQGGAGFRGAARNTPETKRDLPQCSAAGDITHYTARDGWGPAARLRPSFHQVEAGRRDYGVIPNLGVVVAMTDMLRAAVVGAGFFGSLHARKIAGLEDVALAYVVDPVEAAAQKLASDIGADAAGDLSSILDAVDTVTIASPAATHGALAKIALEAGKHVYVEKPITLDTDEAASLIALAETKKLTLTVGHQERYVLDHFGLLSLPGRPTRIECYRGGPFTGRAMDVSVVMDLMIHDIDLMHQVAQGPVVGVESTGAFVHGDKLDEARATIQLEHGTTAVLEASRNAAEKARTMRLVFEGDLTGEIGIDWVGRTMTNTTGAPLTSPFEAGGDAAPQVMTDPLGYGVAHFFASIRAGTAPRVSAREAATALGTALAIENDAKNKAAA